MAAHLGEGEEQGEVAVDAVLLLQHARRLDALPRRGQLDQDPVLADALLLEHRDELARLGDAGLLVERQPVETRGSYFSSSLRSTFDKYNG